MIMGTLGLDNIAVAFALGPLQLGRRGALLLGLWFGFAEAGMALLGSALGQSWLPTMMTIAATHAGVLATLGVAVLGLAWIGRRPAQFVANPSALAGLALLLGLDNLIAGSTADALVLSPAPIVAAGALVGALAAAACVAGGALFRPAPRWGAVASALMLTGLALAGIA
jgi:putative Mn2+ efflux pump MntP